MASSEASRRTLLEIAAATLLIGALGKRSAWAGGRPAAIDAWAHELVGLKEDLRSGSVDVLGWQSRVERLNRAVPLDALVAYLDVDALTRAFRYASPLAEVADPVLPAEIVGAAGMRRWFVRVFGMRRGGAVIPHAHNNMVSAHLVISGSFHARTHDRVQDVADAVVLRPTRDGIIARGDVISMSDRRDNQHWLIAQEDRSMTFDVGVVGLPPSWAYGHRGNRYNMIYVDPTISPERDGTIVAPTLTWEEASAKFAAR
jgi:hypothetical protein